ncbi:MAG: hypothetical protein AAFY56_02695 [Pseudomonadota bacterium]
MSFLPEFDANNFEPDQPIDNQYFPVPPGRIKSFRAEIEDEDTGETIVESNDEFHTFETKEILGLDAVVVRDTAYENNILVEDTLDYYAQDVDGNVWYLGEISYNYEYDDDGQYEETNLDGSWLAGVDGALPGWIMKGDATFGTAYYQEFYPGNAVDEAAVVAVNQEIETTLANYENVLQTLEWTALEPDVAEFKYYAPDIGNVYVEESLDENGEPEAVFELVGTRHVALDTDDPGEPRILELEDDDSEEMPGDPDDDDIEFQLSDLQEGQNLGINDEVEEPEIDDFLGDGGIFDLTFLNEDAGYDNSLGIYTIDTETGEFGEGQIIFTSTDDLDAGETVSIEVDEGKALGVFAVQNGANLDVDLSEFEDGGLFFTNILTGEAANVEDTLAPLVTDEDGDALPLTVFHAIGNDDGFNFLNPAAGVNAVELEVDDFEETYGDGTIIGFEDLRVTQGGYDGDFNDVVVAVSRSMVPPDVVGDLAGSIGNDMDVVIA